MGRAFAVSDHRSNRRPPRLTFPRATVHLRKGEVLDVRSAVNHRAPCLRVARAGFCPSGVRAYVLLCVCVSVRETTVVAYDHASAQSRTAFMS